MSNESGMGAEEFPVPAGEYAPPPEELLESRLTEHARAQLWARFATGAGSTTPENAAKWADALLEEYERRWPGEDPAVA
ncbi:MAG: hypothetical protein QOK36_3813 [Gaiellales bacterium]|nr:hypothetical protein [Gaiellales bacterium]